MAGGTESLDFQNPAGTEQMFHPTVDPDGANLVETRLDYYPWGTTNKIDIATCDVATGVRIEQVLHFKNARVLVSALGALLAVAGLSLGIYVTCQSPSNEDPCK